MYIGVVSDDGFVWTGDFSQKENIIIGMIMQNHINEGSNAELIPEIDLKSVKRYTEGKPYIYGHANPWFDTGIADEEAVRKFGLDNVIKFCELVMHNILIGGLS